MSVDRLYRLHVVRISMVFCSEKIRFANSWSSSYEKSELIRQKEKWQREQLSF